MSRQAAQEKGARPTHTIEDYLMTMHVMERDHGQIIAARLAEMMNVSPATVAVTLKRMERDEWITGKGRKEIHLTDTGRAAAHSVTRRHMLIEWLLVSVFKMPIFETHHEAHAMEHAISPDLEERMRQILGDPKVCPHGNPFPGCEHLTVNWLPLVALAPGQNVILRRIHEFIEDDPQLLQFLQANGVEPGAQARLKESLPFNQTLALTVNNRDVILGFPVARYLFAEVVE
jgi:DtxR family Mn-dependent transcriptional regulator